MSVTIKKRTNAVDMHNLTNQFSLAHTPDGKTIEMLAAREANIIIENYPGVKKLSW